MKNRIILLAIIILLTFKLTVLQASEQFNFDITEVEVTNEGNFFKGLKRGTATTNENQTIITADIFEYDKITNILKANGNVIIEDKIKDFVILSEHITYFKNEEKIFSRGRTNAKIQSKYEVLSSDVNLDNNSNILTSQKKTIITDDEFTKYETDLLNFSINESIFKGSNVKVSTNTNLDENEREFYNFKNGIFDFEKKDFIAGDTKIYVKKNIFDESENDPRIYGNSSKKKENITTINKGIFTSCQLTDSCPPWSIKATTITHDQNKQDIIYKNPLLHLYDFPVFYFPKFTHPDPTVRRRSGFLQPNLNRSNITGTSLLVPYFHVLSDTTDITFKPTIFDSDIYMFHNEYRQLNENSSFVADFGLTKGYQIPNDERNHIGHLFAKYKSKLNWNSFESSKLDFSFQKTTKDTFLKVFDTNLIDINSNIKPSASILQSDITLTLNHKNYDFKTGFIGYENLNGKNSDRFQYIMPYYDFSKNLFDSFDLASFNFSSSGSNSLQETNKLTTQLNNSLNISSIDFFSNLGFLNKFEFYLQNQNSVGKKLDNLKSSPKSEFKNINNFTSKIPLLKYSDYYLNSITPKFSFRFNPTDMKDASDGSSSLSVNNIFDINRLNTNDYEQGKSLTLGIDYRKESLQNINKYFEVKLAGVLRDVEQKKIPTSSSLNQTASNLFGGINYGLSDIVDLNYDFSVDNDFNTFERNSIGLGFSLMRDKENMPIKGEAIGEPKFYTRFDFAEENGKLGDSNYWSNETTINFKEDNYLTFKTRRNRKISFTEYYDLVYQYKNDCLTAGLTFKKSYYADRDVRAKEDLM
ncbi:organic solvent tolerance protein, partial [Candidatus Pelagibacter bacterium]|nr:organic solvent tolerance protein [Candidatus Pelagibacter bacterium]